MVNSSFIDKSARLHYIQWVRGYAMLLGVPFHVGLIYSIGNPWFVTSPEKSRVVTVVTGFITSFRMPLFFYVAGFLSALALNRRDPRAWLMRRVERLGVPLVVATLVISPMIMAAMAYSATSAPGAGEFRTVFQNAATTPGLQWVGHLWFLQVLLLYSLVAVAVRQDFDRLKARLVGRGGNDRLAVPLAWVFVMAAVMALYFLGEKGAFIIARSKMGYHDPLWEMLTLQDAVEYLPFFLLGLFLHDVRLPEIHRSIFAWGVICLSLLLFTRHWNEPTAADKVIRYVCNGMLAIVGGCMILDVASRLVTRRSRISDFLAGSAYTVFLVHYPIAVWLGVEFTTVHWNPLAEYFLLSVITLALSYAVHVLVCRSDILTYLFNGDRRAAHAETEAKAAATRRPSPTSSAE